MHGGVVYVHVVQRHVRVLQADFGDHVFPQLEGFQHIGLVHAGDALAAFLRGLEGDMGDALDLRARIAHGVKRFFAAGEVAVGGNAPSARLAEVNVTGEFADDQNIQPSHQFGLEAGRVSQLRVANRRAEIGKQAHVLAQSQNGLFRAQRAVQLVVFPVAHRAE